MYGICIVFFFYRYSNTLHLNGLTHSFPTRRSSDLAGLATVALAIPALGQNAPESLLPPGFGEPVPAEAQRPQQPGPVQGPVAQPTPEDRKSTRLNSSH